MAETDKTRTDALHYIEEVKKTIVFDFIKRFLEVDSFPFTLQDFSDVCQHIIKNRNRWVALPAIQILAEELKRTHPDKTEEIETLRVEYITAMYAKLMENS